MKKFALLALLIAATLVIGSTTSVAKDVKKENSAVVYQLPTGMFYDAQEQTGHLWFFNAAGREFFAFDGNGDVRAQGIVPSFFHVEPCDNAGPNEQGVVLTVWVAPDTLFSVEEDDLGWHWE